MFCVLPKERSLGIWTSWFPRPRARVQFRTPLQPFWAALWDCHSPVAYIIFRTIGCIGQEYRVFTVFRGTSCCSCAFRSTRAWRFCSTRAWRFRRRRSLRRFFSRRFGRRLRLFGSRFRWFFSWSFRRLLSCWFWSWRWFCGSCCWRW